MSSSAKASSSQWAQRLVRQALAVPDTSGFTDAEDALVSLVHRALDRGSDRPIHHALDQLRAQESHTAADRLAFWAETCASTRDDLPSENPADSQTDSLEASIFLLPALIFNPPGTQWPTTIPPGPLLDTLTHSFRQHHLIGPEPSLAIIPYWYATTDLPATWSGRRRWLNDGLQALRTHQISGFPAPQAPLESPSAPTWQLRWIVGIIVSSHLLHLPWLQNAPEPADTYPEWATTIEAALRTAYPESTVWVESPGPWTPTLAAAITTYHEYALALQLQSLPTLPTLVTITESEAEEAWLLEWKSPKGRATYLWHVPDAQEDALEVIVRTLRHLAIPRMTIVSHSTAS